MGEAEQKKANRWRDWSVRWATSVAMIVGFIAYLVSLRQVGIVVFVFAIQTLIYRELVKIPLNISKERQMPGFSWFYYYWFFVCAFFMYIKTLRDPLLAALGTSVASGAAEAAAVRDAVEAARAEGGDPAGMLPSRAAAALAAAASTAASNSDVLAVLRTLGVKAATFILTKYTLLTAGLYFAGLMAFVFSLRRQRHFMYQFSQFAYCHMALLAVVVQSTFLIANAFQGLIWFFMPISLVVVNDSFAYVFGFLFGRTPLIALSPKKTWEGFVGGAAATLVWAFVGTWLFTAPVAGVDSATGTALRQLMVCPADGLGLHLSTCAPDAANGGIYAFHPVRSWFFGAWLPAAAGDVLVSEMQLHAVVLAVFASLVAPFGGFFASGFKRALKIKDFGNSIPGHGGFTDRMDCQLVMGSFAYVYLTYALNVGTGFRGGVADVDRLFARIVTYMTVADAEALQARLTCFLNVIGDASGAAAAAPRAGAIAASVLKACQSVVTSAASP